MSDKARLEAFKAVRRILDGAYSNLVLPKNRISGIDRAFAENILLGTLERKVTLQYVISKSVQREPQEDLIALLMTGIYQILYMDRVPDNAACNETVNIAKELYGSKASGFVNGVLRNVCRNKEKIIEDIENAEGYIKYSANKELYDLLAQQYPDSIENIFRAFLGKAPTFLRVNTLIADAEKAALQVGGDIVDDSCVVTNETAKAVKLLENGEFFIQGRASQEAVKLLDAKAGETVIDVCACPGGKTLGSAINMNNEGRIYAFDLHENKLSLIENSAKRLGITIITAEKQDAKTAKPELRGSADKVICDVPCSGTGVMGSKPEIKYKSPKDFKGLYPTQRAIIRAAAEYLKTGGSMVYSTCSINKAENEEVVYDFLASDDSFKLIYEKTVMPFDAEHEGFYMAKIIREK